MPRKGSKKVEQKGDLFALLKRITVEKRPLTKEEAKNNSWMLTRFISMSSRLLPIVECLQKYYYLLGERDFANLLMFCTPKGNEYLKYVKGRKVEVLKGLTTEIQKKLAALLFCSSKELPLVVEALVQSGVDVKDLAKMLTTEVRR